MSVVWAGVGDESGPFWRPFLGYEIGDVVYVAVIPEPRWWERLLRRPRRAPVLRRFIATSEAEVVPLVDPPGWCSA